MFTANPPLKMGEVSVPIELMDKGTSSETESWEDALSKPVARENPGG